jgi:hypothetical protein
MQFLWHTALSVIDLGSSLIYNLLGRDLNEDDIKLIEALFRYMSKDLTNLTSNDIITNPNHNNENQTDSVSSTSSNNRVRSNSSTVPLNEATPVEENLNKCLNKLELECLNDETLNKDLINLILKINKGKDLLLVTTKQNGYNLLQFSLFSIFNKSFDFLNQFKPTSHLTYSNELFEKSFDSYVNNRISLFKLLLGYGCDPNRGLILSNKSKYVINLDNSYHLPHLKCSNLNSNKKLLLKSLSNDFPNSNTSDNIANIENNPTNNKSNNPFSSIINTDLNLITSKVTDEETLSLLNVTPIDTPLLLICCIYNCHNLLSLNQNNQPNSNSNNSNSSSNCSLTSSTNKKQKTIKRRFKINRTSPNSLIVKQKQQKINTLNHKTPTLSSFNNNNNNNNNKKSKINLSRRHTIHISKDFKAKNLLFKYNNEGDDYEKLNLTSLSLGSPSSSKKNSASSSGLDSSSSESSSIDEDDRETAISTNQHNKNLQTIKLFNSIVKTKNDYDYDDIQDDQDVEEYFYEEDEEDEEEIIDDNQKETDDQDESTSEEDEYEEEEIEEENDDSSSSDSETCSSNIYDYEELEDEDQSYFNRYEYDVNSNCCNLDNIGVSTNLNYALDACNLNKPNIYKSTEQILINQRNKMSSLSTSMNSLPSSSIQANTVKTITTNITSQSNHHDNNGLNKAESNSKANILNSKHQQKSADYFIYQKINKYRLELVDMLLNYGADKYQAAKLSLNNVKKLNKKSINMLKKWYDCTKPPVGVNSHLFEQNEEIIEQKDSDSLNCLSAALSNELRPLSPLMASLCLDDVEVFSRLYKHHQLLFNYFKPDEDYELIYYAIKFQSKNCLIYLLTNSNTSTNWSDLLSSSFSLPHTKTNSMISDNNQSETINLDQQINKNVNTMFYILENTRSSKILKVLIKCGFDLSKREPATGNTALHFLFSPTLTTNEFTKKANKSMAASVLDEYRVPHSLSKILFIMLKHGGLKIHVDTLNYEKKLCIQVLFEWNELINIVFFKLNDYNERRRLEWQQEFKDCIRLLLKSGADLFLPTHDHTTNTINYINSIDTLIKSILRHSVNENESINFNDEFCEELDPDDLMNISDLNLHNRSPTQSLNNMNGAEQQDNSPQIVIINNDSPKSKSKFHHNNYNNNNNNHHNNFVLLRKLQLYQTQNKKILDASYLLQVLNDTIDMNTLSMNINRNNHHSSMATSLIGTHSFNNPITTSHNKKVITTYSNCLVATFIEILFNSHIDDFQSVLKIIQLLCHYENQLNKLRLTLINHNQTSYYSSSSSFQCNMITQVNPSLIKKLITYLVMLPNFMCSSKQFEKVSFVKNLIVQLVLNDLYDPNEPGIAHANQSNGTIIQSNNLLNHLLKLIFQSKSGYQLDVLYDLMRTLIQYGSNPNLDPFDSTNLTCENLILVQLCRSLTQSQLSPIMQRNLNKSSNNLRRHQHQMHHHCNHHNHNNYYLTRGYHHYQSNDRLNYEESLIMSTSRRNDSNQHLLITPTPSFSHSLSHLTSSASNANISSYLVNQINVTGSLSSSSSSSVNLFNLSPHILYMNHMKNFVKLLFDSMDTNKIQNCLKILSSNQSYNENGYSLLNQNSLVSTYHNLTGAASSLSNNSSCNNSTNNGCIHTTSSNIIYCSINNNNINNNLKTTLIPQQFQTNNIEPLDMFLEKLASTPRSLKSISRRFILNRLAEVNNSQQNQSELQNNNSSIILTHQQLNKLPKKLKNYLLFIE